MITLYTKKENCSGCTACMNICSKNAISMQVDEEGFLYPHINNELCVECGLCTRICPFHDDYSTNENFDTPLVYAVKHKSDDVRLSSSSGGMFTAISDYVLDENGVIYGVDFDENFVVCHKRATTVNERDKFKGSKYVQSDLNQIFKAVKDDLILNRYVLFTGTPCQTAGLYSYLNNKVNTKKLFMCDIVCHGTPSPKIWREYINFMTAKHKKKISQYHFRYKWRGINVLMKFNDGSSIHNKNDLLTFINLFFSHVVLRPSCHNCKFTNFHRPSDITIADFWGIEKCKPEFEDNKGVSLVLLNTPKGQRLFDEIKRELVYEVSNAKDCPHPNLQHPSVASPKREEFWNDYYKYGFVYVIKKYVDYGLVAQSKILVKKILRKMKLAKYI
jgi:coenzyme F420-reducing hydrogenase beta subunit